LSAIVVSKGGEGMPGEGFFKLAKELESFPVGDRMLFWVSEVKRVRDYWSRKS
jgi:hypothetical protein